MTAGPPLAAAFAVQARAVRLADHLIIPAGARGVVVFAHGSGNSRHSSRNH